MAQVPAADKKIHDLSPVANDEKEHQKDFDQQNKFQRQNSLGPSMRKFFPSPPSPSQVVASGVNQQVSHQKSSSAINDKIVDKVAAVRRVQSEITPEQHAAIVAKQDELQLQNKLKNSNSGNRPLPLTPLEQKHLQAQFVNNNPSSQQVQVQQQASENDGFIQEIESPDSVMSIEEKQAQLEQIFQATQNPNTFDYDDSDEDIDGGFEFVDGGFDSFDSAPAQQQAPSKTPSFFAQSLKLSLPSTAFSQQQQSPLSDEPKLKPLGKGIFDVLAMTMPSPSQILSNSTTIKKTVQSVIDSPQKSMNDSVASASSVMSAASTASVASTTSFDAIIKGILTIYAFPIIVLLVIFRKLTGKSKKQ